MNDGRGFTIHNTVVIGTPVLLTGGTEIQTLFLVRVLVGLGKRVVVCCYHEHDSAMVDAYRESGAEVILLSLPRARSLFSMIRLVGVLTRSFRELQPEIIHLQYLEPGLLATLAACFSRSRFVLLSIHYPFAGRPALNRWFFRLSATLSDGVLANSLATELSWFGSSRFFREGEELGHRKHWTIYNCVDYDRVRSIAESIDTDTMRRDLNFSGQYVLVVVGRLIAEKGHSVLFDALALVKERVPNLLLLIVGSGPVEGALRTRAAALGLNEHLRWCGTVSHDDAIRYLAIADCAIVPSVWKEAFGLVAAEAMAVGTVVIASSSGGLPELIEHGVSGFLVETGNAAALAEAIIGNAETRQRQQTIIEAARSRIRFVFSFDSYRSKMEAFYLQLSRVHQRKF